VQPVGQQPRNEQRAYEPAGSSDEDAHLRHDDGCRAVNGGLTRIPETPANSRQSQTLSHESDPFSAYCASETFFSAICGMACCGCSRGCFDEHCSSSNSRSGGIGIVLLCALDLPEPCTTFRPNEAQLRPPQQLRFVFRQERRSRAAWAFPSAQEQAALHP
jgi:hypothetical protein